MSRNRLDPWACTRFHGVGTTHRFTTGHCSSPGDNTDVRSPGTTRNGGRLRPGSPIQSSSAINGQNDVDSPWRLPNRCLRLIVVQMRRMPETASAAGMRFNSSSPKTLRPEKAD